MISSEIAGLLRNIFGASYGGEGLPLVVPRHDFLQQIREPPVGVGELIEDLVGGIADFLLGDPGCAGLLI
jgi:hypothetical protein